jgi:hypothetical protein
MFLRRSHRSDRGVESPVLSATAQLAVNTCGMIPKDCRRIRVESGTLEVRPDAPRPSRSPTDRAVVSEFDVRSNGDQRIPLKYIEELNYFFV